MPLTNQTQLINFKYLNFDSYIYIPIYRKQKHVIELLFQALRAILYIYLCYILVRNLKKKDTEKTLKRSYAWFKVSAVDITSLYTDHVMVMEGIRC